MRQSRTWGPKDIASNQALTKSKLHMHLTKKDKPSALRKKKVKEIYSAQRMNIKYIKNLSFSFSKVKSLRAGGDCEFRNGERKGKLHRNSLTCPDVKRQIRCKSNSELGPLSDGVKYIATETLPIERKSLRITNTKLKHHRKFC